MVLKCVEVYISNILRIKYCIITHTQMYKYIYCKGKLFKVQAGVVDRLLFQLLCFRLLPPPLPPLHLLTRNYKSCYVLDVMHLKNSETKVCRHSHRQCTNHIRISQGNDASLTSHLNLLPLRFLYSRSIFFHMFL